MNEFRNYHPLVNFIYFMAVIVFAMFLMHPVCLFISFLCSFLYSVMLNGKKTLKFYFSFLIPTMLFAILLNAAFNHEGVTILGYFPTGNPFTFESIAYGAAAATMLVTVIGWFSCYNRIMTSDKLIYLFGKIIPSLSLILSMTLRFVPRFQSQVKVISRARQCVGRGMSQGSIMKRAKNGICILSVMVTWALENAVETADSMRNRGYGLPNRSAFSIFIFDKRDGNALAYLFGIIVYLVIGVFRGGMYFRYFPSMKTVDLSAFTISMFAAYFMLCITPVLIELWEAKKWKAIKSRI